MPPSTPSASAFALVDALHARAYPFDRLLRHPISAIETMAASDGKVSRGACTVGCLACCADAIHPGEAENGVVLLSPRLFRAFLDLAAALASDGIDILSTGRLNLFSASNELDHPNAVIFRRMLSAYMVQRYGVSLGHFSSDIVFHVSKTEPFLRNLNEVIPESTLWDSVCVAIDEQVPFASERDYRNYLEKFREVWRILMPALRIELPHAKADRQGQARVVLNLLIPDRLSTFQADCFRLFPGGPPRATSFEQLVARYVAPFVGGVREVMRGRPRGHEYTTGIAELTSVNGSRVYISAGTYAQQGRAGRLIDFKGRHLCYRPAVVRTKLLPVSDREIQIRASYASGIAAEDDIEGARPPWFATMNATTIDLGPITRSAPTGRHST